MVTDVEQLRLDAPAGRRIKGRWETRAERLIRRLRADGLPATAAGWTDALRMAGQDRDRVEADPDATHHAHQQARRGWTDALAALTPPPTTGQDPSAALDPFTALHDALNG